MKRPTSGSYTYINVVDNNIAVLSSAIRTCIVVAHWLAHAHTAQNKNECAF